MSLRTVSDGGLEWINDRPGPHWSRQELGTYAYSICAAGRADFVTTPVVEQYAIWVRDDSDSSQVRIRACRDALATPQGIELRVETHSDPSGSTMEFQSRDAGDAALQRVLYRVDGNRLNWHRGPTEPSAHDWRTLDLPEGCIFLPLMRNFLGPVLSEVVGRPERQAFIAVPELAEPRANTVFTPTVDTRTASLISNVSEYITLAERTWDCLSYRFIGGPYGSGSTFWVCQNSQRLIRYIFETQTGERWSADLVRLDSLPGLVD